MTRIRHTEEQIIAVLKDTQAGVNVQDLCRKNGISDATFYKWRMKFAGREGWSVNHKKVERIYREEGLSLRRRTRKKSTSVPRLALPMPTRQGLWYAMDFVHDRLANGRRFKCLTMTDPYSKEVPVIEVDSSIGGERVCRILDRVFARRPMPEVLMLDNGPEFAGNALDARADQHRVTLHFIQPGKPVQNAFIESSNGKFRDERLNEHRFLTL